MLVEFYCSGPIYVYHRAFVAPFLHTRLFYNELCAYILHQKQMRVCSVTLYKIMA